MSADLESRSRPRSLARILLACGCTVRARDVPLMNNQKFICDTGSGHGYKGYAWVRCEFDGRTTENK